MYELVPSNVRCGLQPGLVHPHGGRHASSSLPFPPPIRPRLTSLYHVQSSRHQDSVTAGDVDHRKGTRAVSAPVVAVRSLRSPRSSRPVSLPLTVRRFELCQQMAPKSKLSAPFLGLNNCSAAERDGCIYSSRVHIIVRSMPANPQEICYTAAH
jgi:hypothetical protein